MAGHPADESLGQRLPIVLLSARCFVATLLRVATLFASDRIGEVQFCKVFLLTFCEWELIAAVAACECDVSHSDERKCEE